MKTRQIQFIFRKLFQQFRFESVLIYTYKSHLDKVRKAVEAIKPDMKIAYDYFFGSRGTNQYQDCEAVVIFGSAYPDINELIAKENAQNAVELSKHKVDGVYQDPRLVQAIEETDFNSFAQSDTVMGRTISSLINLNWTEEQAKERASKMAETIQSVL